MRDPRVDNLARILVRYSTEVKEGETCVIEGPTAAEPLIAAVYEEVLRRGRPPARWRCRSRASRRLLRARLRRAARVGLAAVASGGRGGRLPDRDRRRDQHPRALRRSIRSARRKRQRGHPDADGDDDEARRPRASHRWVYTLFPTDAYASDAEMSLARVRGLLLRRLPGRRRRPGRRLGARLGGVRTGSPTGSRGARRCTSSRPGTDIRLGIAGRKFIAATASTTCPTASSSPAPVEDSVEGEVSLPPAGDGRRPRGRRGPAAVRVRQGRRRERRARRGVPDRACSTPTRARGASASSGSAPTTGSTAAPATCCSTRRSAAPSTWRSAPATRSAGGDNESAVHTDLVCDLRRGGRIEVDGELLQENGRFVV